MAAEEEVNIQEEVKDAIKSEEGEGEKVSSTVKSKEQVKEKQKESGIRKRININLPGIYSSNKESKKPPSYGWAQQRLPACRPVYNGLYVFVIFMIVGVVFVALGGVFLGFNLKMKEYSVPYTNCNSRFPNETESVRMGCTLFGNEEDFPTCADYASNISQFGRSERNSMNLCPCYCQVFINVEEDMESPVYVYYQLTNYYQNHRRYVNSWSALSLRANNIENSRSDCTPFDDNGTATYFPCGMIANSFFNDTLSIQGMDIDNTNIAWKWDRDVRFRNPPSDLDPFNTSLIDTADTILPPNWLRLIDHGQRNESFMVWFRVAAFPTFRKLYGRITPPNGAPLSAGNYTINIVYNYPVTSFEGTKTFILAEVSALGSRNLFLGIAYIVTGGLSILSGIFMLIVHLTCSRWKINHKNFLDRDF